MKFKKNGTWGWLYKYNQWCNGNLCTINHVNASQSICPYFWKSMWNLVAVNTIYLVLGSVMSVLLSLIPVEGLGLFTDWVGENGTWIYFFKNILVGLGTLASVFFVVWVWLAFLMEPVFKFFRKFKSDKPPVEKEPNMAIEWVKAKKNKVCPMIEWED